VKDVWIEKHRRACATKMMFELMSVSRSGLNAACDRAPSKRANDDEQLVRQIRDAQGRHRGRYGRRRMTTEISEVQGRAVNHKRVARVMREHGLQSHKRRRFRVVTTDSKHAHPVAPNVLERDFEATAPNQKWLADMTYVPTKEGWLYLALVLDLYARKLVGWAMSETMPQELTLSALDVALGVARSRCGPAASLGPRVAVRGEGLPEEAQGARHHDVDEPQGRLLGQRTDGIGQRHREGRVRQRRDLPDAGAGTPGDHRVHRLLQH